MSTLWSKLQDFFSVPDTFDPDDLRLRRVCNGVLIIIGFISLVSAAFSWVGVSSLYKGMEVWPIYSQRLLISVLGFVLSVGLFLLNRWRRTPRHLVGFLLLCIVVTLLVFSDSPEGLLGQSQNIWVWPILLAAIVLPPRSTFVVDGILTVIIILLTPAPVLSRLNYWMLLTLFTIAFFAWLGMSVAERAIRDARNEAGKNRAILDSVADGVVVVAADNKITLANPVALELLNGEMSRILPAAENVEIDRRILSLRWNTVQGVGRVAIIRDISRQVEIEHAKDAVLRVVSHEMRTPLAAILGFTEVLSSQTMSNSELLKRIRTNAQRMMTLVNDLLDQAYIEAGVLKMQNEAFSPASLAKTIQDSFSAHSTEKQVTLHVTVSESLPELLIGDLHRYQQILSNLVDNAIKFTKAGGRVEVLLAPCEDAEKWQMIVSDTGIGIPSERLPDIFLPFRRASDYTTRRYQGVGLGLSIARRIAGLAHGDIEVKSMVGHGSTFLVTLPINGGAG